MFDFRKKRPVSEQKIDTAIDLFYRKPCDGTSLDILIMGCTRISSKNELSIDHKMKKLHEVINSMIACSVDENHLLSLAFINGVIISLPFNDRIIISDGVEALSGKRAMLSHFDPNVVSLTNSLLGDPISINNKGYFLLLDDLELRAFKSSYPAFNTVVIGGFVGHYLYMPLSILNQGKPSVECCLISNISGTVISISNEKIVSKIPAAKPLDHIIVEKIPSITRLAAMSATIIPAFSKYLVVCDNSSVSEELFSTAPVDTSSLPPINI